MPSPKLKPKPFSRQVHAVVPSTTVDALAMEAARLTHERGNIVSVSAVVRAALNSYLARVQRVAPAATASVGGA